MGGVTLWTAPALGAAAAALVGAGVLGVALLSLRAHLRPAIRTIWPDLAVLVAILLAVFATLHWHALLATPVLCLMGARVGWEVARILHGPRVAWGAAAIGAAIPLLPMPVLPLAALWLACVALRAALPDGPLARSLDIVAFPALPFAIFAALFQDPSLAPAFLAALILGETFDSYALLSGRLFGRRKLAPRLSPKKTVEGIAGGALMLVATAALAALVASDITLPAAIGGAILVGALTLYGDLAASHLKRRAAVKDYPLLFPPQGGLLDVLDSWIVAGAGLALVTALV